MPTRRTQILGGATAVVLVGLAAWAAATMLPGATPRGATGAKPGQAQAKAKVPGSPGAAGSDESTPVELKGHATGTSPGESWVTGCGHEALVQPDDSFTLHVGATPTCSLRVFTMVGSTVALGPAITVEAMEGGTADVAFPSADSLVAVDASSPVHAPVTDLGKLKASFDPQCADPAPEMAGKCHQVEVLEEKERRTIVAGLLKSQ
jgi:hypothetical protein